MDRISKLLKEQTEFPDQTLYTNDIDSLKNANKNSEYFSEEELEHKISQFERQFMDAANHWKLTVDEVAGVILSIKLSTLIELLRYIFPNSKFNILDYSCNSPSIYIPRSHHHHIENIKKAYERMDEYKKRENRFGGKTRRHRKKQNRKTKRYRNNKTSKLNK